MAQRLNKKLLLGLGSSLGFLGTGVVSGFGVNAIVNNNRDGLDQNQLFNTLQEVNYTQAPDYNVATRDMFIDTTNLRKFHFGNTQIGQTVTPLGWLGVFEDSATKKNRIALTSWSGEILWVNEDYKNDSTDRYNVYDMKYDYNTNTIFVMRTNSPNGMFNIDGTLASLQLDVLDGTTGRRIYDRLDSQYFVNSIQNSAKKRMEEIFLNNNSTNEWRLNQNRFEKLYYLDVASQHNSNEVVVSYIPKFIQLVQRKRLSGLIDANTLEPRPDARYIANDKAIKLISANEFVDSWHKMVLTIRLDRKKIDQNLAAHSTRKYVLRNSPRLGAGGATDIWRLDNGNSISLSNHFLIINPFLTISDKGNDVIHFVAANETGTEVYHKMITFRKDGPSNGSNGFIREADRTQRVGGRNIYSFTLPNVAPFTRTWGYAERWSDLIVKANLIPNRNIFDNNSIVIAYPYASNQGARQGSGLPVFNVQQLLVDPQEQFGGIFSLPSAPNQTDTNPKMSQNFEFGTNIINNYRTFGNQFETSSSVNNIYPWPTSNSANITTANIDRLYNRLLTVSPFDNTIIYAAKPNIRNNNLNMTDANSERSVGLWIGSRNSYNLKLGSLLGKRTARPFLITNWNEGDVASNIDLAMTNPKSLYEDGVTFDILSTTIDKSNNAHLNLYYNQTGSGTNDTYNGNNLRTSKIGLLDDVLKNDKNLWTENIASLDTTSGTASQKIQRIRSTIKSTSYATLIHSRAKLETWFARTWLNNTSPANLYADGYQLNAPENQNTRASAQQFGNTLSGAEFNNQTSVDLVSHWQDKNGANPPNYDRLAIKRPKIVVKGSAENKLPIQTTYDLVNNGDDFYLKPGWGIDRDRSDTVIYKTFQEITNASYQIFTSWKEQVRINSIGSNNTIGTSTLNIRENHNIKGNPQWYDARKQGALTSNQFGKIHNEVAINQVNPLRMVLKIAKPTGNLPQWFRQLDSNRFFDTKYPLAKDAVNDESTFQEVLQQFLNEKTRRIDLGQDGANAAIGLANLRIEAYLDVNPRVISGATAANSKIFTNGQKRILVANNQGQRIIYEDLYRDPYHQIYDQSAINYVDFDQYGFGNTVRAAVQTSWQSGALPAANQKILTEINANDLPDTLVRKSSADERLFTFSYKENDPSKIVLNPIDRPWFKNHLLNYQRLLGMQARFEFKQDPNSAWRTLTTTNDVQNRTYLQTNDTFEIPSASVSGITELRIVLVPMNPNDADNFVQFSNYNTANPAAKFVSAPQLPLTQKIKIDPNWFNQVTLANANGATLDQISATELTNYENQLKDKLKAANQNSTEFANQVELRYSFESKTNLDAAGLVNALKQALNDQNRSDRGLFSLWDGTRGIKVKATWQLKNGVNDRYILVNLQGNEITNPAGRTGDLRNSIQTKIDLSEYFSQLITTPLQALKDNRDGRLRGFDMPSATGGRLNGLNYDQINGILNPLGLTFQYKENNNGVWSNWADKERIKNYNPQDPAVMVGLAIVNGAKIKVLVNQEVVGPNYAGVKAKLNLPKLVKLPTNEQQLIDNFNRLNVFGGNTFELTVNDVTSGLNAVADVLINASATTESRPEYEQLKANGNLVLKFKLGTSTYLEAAALKTYLAGQTTADQTSNALFMKVELNPAAANQFVLEPTLAAKEFPLLPDNNQTIKKWLHGTTYEAALRQQNAITLQPGSNKNNLQYNYVPALQSLFSAQGQTGLVVQWRLGSQGDNDWKNLKGNTNPLPRSVGASENEILIRVAHDPSDNIYLYGPETKNTRQQFRLDLSRIPTQVEINNQWFNELTLSVNANQFLQDLNVQHFTTYENAFFAKSTSLNGNAALRAKVKLQYQFNKRGNWMDAAQIVTDIQGKLNNFSTTDQGVWALSHDGTTYSGNNGINKGVYVINARVTTVQPSDPAIQFVNPANPDRPISGTQLEGNLKSNIKNRVDLSAWFNEIITKGITAARGNRPGQLNASTIVIPGKDRPAGGATIQFGNKTFAEIEAILNKVNLFFQYKKYDSTTGQWSGWIDNKNQIDMYDPKNPEIVLGLKSANPASTNNQDRIALNVQPLYNGQNFNAGNELRVKLNVPKLVQPPANPAQTIGLFNDQQAFGGNTFQLSVDNPKLINAQNEFVNAIKTASQVAGRFDNLDTALFFTYKLGDSPDWKSANDLKAYLASKTNSDQTSNELKIKVNLQPPNPGANPEFELNPNSNWEYVLLDDDNETIKKWIHGTAYETALAQPNAITSSGSKNNLSYTFTKALEVFQDAATFPKGLTLEYQLNGTGNWVQNALPTRVEATVTNLKVRISKKSGQNIYIYGPAEKPGANQKPTDQRQIFTIDLSQNATILKVDPAWFMLDPLTNTVLDNLNKLTPTIIKQWEQRIWAKVNDNAGVPAQLQDKVVIKYTFRNQEFTADTLGAALVAEQSKFNDPEHHGIVKLWDPQDQTANNGYQIKATFAKVAGSEQLVEFQKEGINIDQNEDQRRGNVNTANLQSQIDLSGWINFLTNPANPTVVATDQPGIIPNGGLKPPTLNGAPNSQLFAGANFNDLEGWLKKAQIELLWSNDKTNWTPTNQTTKYDASKGTIFFAIRNNSTNLNLKTANNKIIAPRANNFSDAWTITLQAPKIIKIDVLSDVSGLDQAFSNNTKFITVNETLIKQKLDAILARHGANFANAPLSIEFSVGQKAYYDYKSLRTELEKETNDALDRSVEFKFVLNNPPGSNEYSFDPASTGLAGTALADGAAANKLKIYVNDKNIFNDLGQTRIQAGGTSENFTLEWQNGIRVDANNGSLSGSSDNNGPKGEGLELHFSFNPNVSATENNVGNDPYVGWTKTIPTSVRPGFNNLYLRIRVRDPQRFEYEKVDQKITVALQIKQIITLDANALQKPIVTSPIENLNQLDIAKFQAYEQAVWRAANLAPNVQPNVKIEYTFKGQNYRDGDQQNSLNALIQALQNYKNAYANEANLGILQLWNGFAGEKITTKFVKADPNSADYDLKFTAGSNNYYELDFANVITTIDFSAVLTWLKTLELQGQQGQNNSISNIEIPPVTVNSQYFQNKAWSAVETALQTLNMELVYSNNLPNEAEKWGPLTSVNKYDPTSGTFKMKLIFKDNQKSKNLKVNLGDQILNGATDRESNVHLLKLKVRLTIQLRPDLTTQFINQANITGNTKNLIINDAQRAEAELIKQIKAFNGDRFNNAQLVLEYQLGQNVAQDQWKSLTGLKTFLEQETTDKTTNKIWFRFHVNNPTEFSVDENPQVLTNHVAPTDRNLKIKYFVHTAEWETKAGQLQISGPNNQINWNFETVFGAQNVSQANDGKVYLRNQAGNALQVYFIANNPNAQYDNPGLSDNAAEINTKWVSKKPTAIAVGTTNLKIQIRANQGYVYEAQDGGTAAAHNVQIRVQNLLYVNKDWLAVNPLVTSELDVSALNKTHLDAWEAKVYEEIRRRNNINQDIAQKIQIKYLLEGQTNGGQGLIDQITALRTNYRDDQTLGIIQIWNGQQGLKLQAKFEITDPNYALRVDGNSNDPSASDLTNQVDTVTNKIFTSISLGNYIDTLKSNNHKTEVTLDPNKGPGAISNFTPPAMPGNVGQNFLSGRSYDQIAQRLAAVGITITFSKDPATNQWGPKETIKAYDVQKNALFLAFEITSSNIKIQLDATTTLNPGQNNQANAIKLPLNVKKTIVIDQSKPFWQNLSTKFNFRKNTKELDFDLNQINSFLDAIKNDNFVNSGNDAAYQNAPLEIHFQLSNLAFTEIKTLKAYLQSQNNDVESRDIRFKFAIAANETANWQLISPDTEYTLLTENDPLINQIKIFINDNGNFDKLKQMELQGTQEELIWPWPWNNVVNEQTGILNPPKGGFGRGLKLQFSFDGNASSEGTNVETQWADRVPKTFNPKYNQIWVRLHLVDSQKYTYTKADEEFALSLTEIPKIIKLNTQWLNQQLRANQQFNLQDLNVNDFTDYETKIKNLAQADATNPVDSTLLTKFKIEYQFNDQNQWFDKTALMDAIRAYQNNYAQATLGILQLWNEQAGVKINARFADADENDKFTIQTLNGAQQTLNTANVQTTIDFSAVLSWLKQLELKGTEGPQNTISNIQIPPVNVSGAPNFHNKPWNEVEAAFKLLNINIVYSNNVPGEAENWGPLAGVNKFDPTSGTFKMKFVFANNQKSKNLKLKTDNQELDGATAKESNVHILKLKVRLTIQLDQGLIDQFVASANIRGNTKNILIDTAKIAQEQLVNKIKEFNGDRYDQAQLSLEYYLGTTTNNNTQWSTSLEQLQETLEQVQTDQTTNQIWFRFHINNPADFNVDQTARVLSQHQNATDPTIKIKYFVHTANWEKQANQIILSGPNNQLIWNFGTIFGTTNVDETNDGKVYLRNNAGSALQVYFIVNNSNAQYDNPGLSDNEAEINTKWVSKKPTSILPGTTSVKIHIRANQGYVYQAQEAKQAQAHNVELRVQNLIYVDKTWLSRNSLVTTELDVSALQKSHLDTWENLIYEQIKAKNGIDDLVARKVKINYIFAGQTSDGQGLIDQITALRTNYNDPQLGIVQIWNGQQGLKIEAIFTTDDQSYALRVDGNPGEPTVADLKGEVDTVSKKIFTSISLGEYINVLKSDNHKTEVVLDPSETPGAITSFNPPTMTGAVGQNFLSGRSYDQIAQRLAAVGVEITFSKDPTTNQWGPKNTIKAYDIQKNALFLAFEIKSSNIRIQLDATTTLNPTQNNRNSAIKLPLNVKKFIVINNNQPFWTNLPAKFNFRETTKEIDFDLKQINDFIQAIREDNFNNSAGDTAYKSAPLEIHFQVGQQAFTEINALKGYLQRQNNDLPTRDVQFKFAIKKSEESRWQLLNPDTEYTLLTEKEPLIKKIKIFINDNGNYQKLTQMRLEGTQDQLDWPWPWGKNSGVNETTGVLEPAANGFGKGLKLQFSFNPNANSEGPDVETQWASAVPRTFKSQYNQIWLQIQLTNPDLYTYENINQKFALSLEHILKVIKLDTRWLEKQLNQGNKLELQNLNLPILTQYEAAVKQAAQNDNTNPVDGSLLDKFKIEYQFNNDQTWVDANGLLAKIQTYQINQAQTSFGILQLWNTNAGVQIKTKFTDADLNDNYQIALIDSNQPDKILETSNVVTTIDFSPVLNWLQSFEIPIKEAGNNQISEIKIPDVVANQTPFNGKSWSAVEKALASFGIIIEYSNNLTTSPEQWGPLSGVNQYNPQSPTFKIRLRFDGTKSKNMQVQLPQNVILSGATAQSSNAYILQLKARLLVAIDPAFLTKFQNAANIRGNTKIITIDQALTAQTNLIQEIIDANTANDPRYAKLAGKLKLQFVMQNQQPNENAPWKALNEFKTYLEEQTNDQTSNQIWYKIVLEDKENFNISTNDEAPKILSPHQPATAADLKILYYINDADWEAKATQITISGPSTNLAWNFAAIFGTNNVVETADQVYLRTAAGQALKVYFIIDQPGATYNQPGQSDDLADIRTKWVSKKPQAIPAGTTSLKIKLVANTGYVYGPATANPIKANAHDVEINVQNVLFVDKRWFNRPLLDQEKEISALKQSDFQAWEDQIYQLIQQQNQTNEATARKVKIKYLLAGEAQTKYDAADLIDKINELRTNYGDQKTLGIIQLWNKQTRQGLKIEAIFTIDPADQQKYTLRAVGNQNEPSETDLKDLVDTTCVYTSISLIKYIDVLKNQKTTVTLPENGNPGDLAGFVPPQISGPIGATFLSGYTYDQIAQRLATVGVQIRFAKTASTVASDWIPKEQVNSYDIQTSALFLSFEIEPQANIKIQWSNTETLEPGQNMRGDKAIKLPLDVPKYIIINPNANFWSTIRTDFAFRGTTKIIEFNIDKINEFIAKILNDNFIASNDATYKQAPLKIEFQVGDQAFTEINELKAYLQKLPDDLPNRSVHFKFSIPENEAANWQLQNPDETYTLLTETNPEIKQLKIYINDKGIFEDLQNTKLSGTSQALKWEFANGLQINPTDGILTARNRGRGLRVEFTFNEKATADEAPGTDVNLGWVSQMPTTFVVNQTKIFLRIALVDESLYAYDRKYEKIELSLNDIVLILNLETAWLKLIELSGTTKNLTINEDRAKAQLINALPLDKPNLVQFKYSIDGQNWNSANEFKTFLINQNGQKDANNFILKREDIKVRFELVGTETELAKYQMSIDGNLITPDNANNPTQQLINDSANDLLNEAVRGVIEVTHLKNFIKNNFKIQGTNNALKLKIEKRTEMNTLMQVYATDRFFDIKITGTSTSNGFDWSKAVSILQNGQFIAEDGLAAAGFVLDGNKKVALRFESTHAKYDVYYNNDLQNPGYVLDISDNVQVTFEIENPFTKNKKTLALWWTADQKKTEAKYFQGQGGFKIVNGDLNGNPDLGDYQSAQQWINSAQSGLSDKEKSVLEFVYHIYENQPDQTQINQIEAKINRHDDATWKPLAADLENGANANDFTRPLGLKVGQYVSVALRVKKEFSVGDDLYVLKDNDTSFVRPITADGKTPGRAHGYKVKTAAVKIDEKQIELENILNSEQAPLDGYTNIKRLVLEQDSDENYQGVDLELQLFHEFHQPSNQQGIIITPFDKIKLVKRTTSNKTLGNFKDANGNEFTDQNNQPIPIFVDKDGKPTAPIMINNATFTRQFDNYRNGIFGLTLPTNSDALSQWGIFKNETIKINFKAYEGIGGQTDPDFILDQPKEVDLKNQISPQIKFPIFNQENIKYDFNHEAFKKDKIKFINAAKPDQAPTEGKSMVQTLIQLFKKTNNGQTQTIEGTDQIDTINKLKAELAASFQNKLRFETIYEQATGGKIVYNDLKLYDLKELKNGDRIKINIVSADNDFIWAEPPKTLAIQVSGLTTKAPNRDRLQFLRVEQGGKIQGQGSFKVLVNNPSDVNSDPKEILQGWKFVLRVWDQDKNIKHGWTADQEKINDLKNGDKVEWKLLDEFSNPVEDAYYNTIAGEHQLDPTTGKPVFNFQQMHYPNGSVSGKIVQSGIGAYPADDETYPIDSGFVISGLQDALEVFEISDTAFAKVMAQLEPHYVGLNGQGTINFKEDYLSKNYYVNSFGELYEKPFDQPGFKQQVDDSVVEISLADFLANTTFYTSDPNLINYQNGFKFLGNDTNLNNHLSNGDQVWAQFDLRADNNEVNRGISTELNPVTGLKDVVTDPMTPLWYILMAIGGVVTLGGLSLLMLWIKRNRKLKK